MARKRTEVVFDESALADIAAIIAALPRFQKNGPIYKRLMRVLASIEALSLRAHMYPFENANLRYRKCSVAGYVILYAWEDNGSEQGPLATIKRVIPSEWERRSE